MVYSIQHQLINKMNQRSQSSLNFCSDWKQEIIFKKNCEFLCSVRMGFSKANGAQKILSRPYSLQNYCDIMKKE